MMPMPAPGIRTLDSNLGHSLSCFRSTRGGTRVRPPRLKMTGYFPYLPYIVCVVLATFYISSQVFRHGVDETV